MFTIKAADHKDIHVRFV